jgi:cysteine desulfurase
MEIYFDNSATTLQDEKVTAICLDVMTKVYGNPSSIHKKGLEAEKIVKAARNNIANLLDVEPKEIIFTSGGTESNNTAILGVLENLKRFGNKIITSSVEHPSVLKVVESLSDKGYNVKYIDVTSEGILNINQLEKELTDDVILVSIMHVNNETGAINDIEKIGTLIKSKNAHAVFHVDAVQSFGKLNINPKKCHIDLLSMSSHKINGPKGIGALYCSKSIKVQPLLLGGGQENDFRSGTENVPGIAGFGQAAIEKLETQKSLLDKYIKLRSYFIKKLEEIEDFKVNSSIENSAPYILNISFLGVRSEVLVHALANDNVFVSAGSACSSRKVKYSYVLEAMNFGLPLLESAIRFSFGVQNTTEEIDYCIEALKKNLKILRKFKRR